MDYKFFCGVEVEAGGRNDTIQLDYIPDGKRGVFLSLFTWNFFTASDLGNLSGNRELRGFGVLLLYLDSTILISARVNENRSSFMESTYPINKGISLQNYFTTYSINL